MNKQQPEALLLADEIQLWNNPCARAANVLRRQFDEIKRLHSVNAELLDALNTLLPDMRGLAMVSPLMKTYVEICETAIAKAAGLNKTQE